MHVHPARRHNPPPVELPEARPLHAPPSITQEAALSLPGIKDPLDGAAERYRDILTLPLAGMFTGWIERPKTTKGVEETDTDAYKGVAQWERQP